MLNGMTYMVLPRMHPRKRRVSVAFISLGLTQLFVGPASSLRTLQMKVRSSTRATSVGSDRERKLFGRFFSFNLMKVPDATIFAQSSRSSSFEPSHQGIPAGSNEESGDLCEKLVAS